MESKRKYLIIGLVSILVLLLVFIFIIIISSLNKKYVVTFDTNSKSKIEHQIIKPNEKISKPIDPKKEGYEFDGWYFGNEKYYFNSKVNQNMALEAKWIKDTSVKYTITFDSDGGTVVNSINVGEGKIPTKPKDPQKEGYIFSGWTLSNNPYLFDTKIVSNITLKANWVQNNDSIPKYSVSFDSNGGTGIATQIISENEKVTKPKDPQKEGYTFNKWLLNEKSYDFNSKVTSNISLVASWTKLVSSTQTTASQKESPANPTVVKYNVTFNSNGGTNVSTQVITAGATATTPANPTKTGYSFINWTLNGIPYNFNTSVNDNITLVANWQVIVIPDVYTVRLELINGDENSPERKAVILKNGSVIQAVQLQNQNGNILGNYIDSLGYIRVNKASYQDAITLKIKLSNGTIVSANKV